MMELWPFTNFHDLNLDWIIKTIKTYTKKVDDFTEDITNAWDTFRNYINHEIAEMHRKFAIYVNVTEEALNTGAIADGAITKPKIYTPFLNELTHRFFSLEQIGVICDSTTDNTQLITDYFTQHSDMKSVIIVPYGCKYDTKTVQPTIPEGSILFNLNSVNIPIDDQYKRKMIEFMTQDDPNNDTEFTVTSGHYPALAFVNTGTADYSDIDPDEHPEWLSGIMRKCAIAFCDGYDVNNHPQNYMTIQTYKAQNRWWYTLIADKAAADDTPIDRTILGINESGEMSINAMQTGYELNVENKPTSANTQARIHNRNNNSTARLTMSAKSSGGDTVAARLQENGNGTFEVYIDNESKLELTDKKIIKHVFEVLPSTYLTGATPSISEGNKFEVRNTSATNMTNITGPDNNTPRMVITLYFMDQGLTTLVNGEFVLKNNSNWTPTYGSSITLLRDTNLSGKWIEVGRYEK